MMRFYSGILLLLLSWTAFCKGTTTGGIASGKCGNVCKDIDGKRWCDDYCKDGSGALVKVLIGPVLPLKVPASFSWEYELCQEGKCVWATNLGTFGGFGSQPPSVISRQGYFIRSTDVTRVLVEQGWSPEKLLTARMTSSTRQYVADNLDVKNLPEPVMLVGGRSQVHNGGGKLTLNPNED